MQEHDTFPGKVYAVTCASGCTITDNKGRTLGECEAGKQTLVVATSDKLVTSADALVTVTFNSAPAALMALGLLGGGAATGSALPAGYIAADFLDYNPVGGSNGSCGINVEVDYDANSDVEVEVMAYTSKVNGGFFGSYNYNASNPFFGSRFTSNSVYAFCLGREWKDLVFEPYLNRKIIIRKNKKDNYVDGVLVNSNSNSTFEAAPGWIWCWAKTTTNLPYQMPPSRLYSAKISNNGITQRKMVAALDPAGKKCMYDFVGKRAFYIEREALFDIAVGMTCKQALKLADLPATGGSLTVSLPTGYESDAGVDAALKAAAAKGWNITERTHEAEASAVSTFGMRRIWVRRKQNENGMYVDSDGKRWQVDWCVGMHNHDGSEPDAHGYELFRSVDAAVAYWELEPWVDPEELLLEQ